jgi:hypothetical protein
MFVIFYVAYTYIKNIFNFDGFFLKHISTFMVAGESGLNIE